MNARAVAAWTVACLFIVLFTTNPAYKAQVHVNLSEKPVGWY